MTEAATIEINNKYLWYLVDQWPEQGNLTLETETQKRKHQQRPPRGQTCITHIWIKTLEVNTTPLFLFLHVGTHLKRGGAYSEGVEIKLLDVWINEQRTC